MKILNKTKNTIIAGQATMADTFLTRMVGLLNRESLFPGEALIITRCNSIHMFFMRFAIDVIFIDRNNQVVGLLEEIKPYRMSKIFFKSDKAIECPVGVIKNSRTEVGDLVVIKEGIGDRE